MIEKAAEASVPLKHLPSAPGKLRLMRPHLGILLCSTLVGYIVSVIPSHGADPLGRLQRPPEARLAAIGNLFGRGNPEGLIASEAAANGSVPGALVPTLGLGIPGSASTAVLIGALTLRA